MPRLLKLLFARTINHFMVGATRKTEIFGRNREVALNSGIMKRVGGTVVHLEKQGSTFRGHLIDDSEAHKGNFLESLKNQFEKNQPLRQAFTLFGEEFQNCTYLQAFLTVVPIEVFLEY